MIEERVQELLLYCFFKEKNLVILLDQNRGKKSSHWTFMVSYIIVTESKNMRTILLNLCLADQHISHFILITL